jgi:hypothetical protein
MAGCILAFITSWIKVGRGSPAPSRASLWDIGLDRGPAVGLGIILACAAANHPCKMALNSVMDPWEAEQEGTPPPLAAGPLHPFVLELNGTDGGSCMCLVFICTSEPVSK